MGADLRPVDVVMTTEYKVGLDAAGSEQRAQTIDSWDVGTGFPTRDGGLRRSRRARQVGLGHAAGAPGGSDHCASLDTTKRAGAKLHATNIAEPL